MRTSKFFTNSLKAFILAQAITLLAFGQNLVITGGGSVAGTGTATFNIKGNIQNSAATAAVTFNGTVNLSGTGAQSIGNNSDTSIAVNFTTIAISGGSTKTLGVNSSVSSALDVASGAASSFDIGTNILTLQGTIANTAGATSPYNFSSSTSTVVYNGASQALFGTSYGKLTMNGSGTYTTGGVITTSGAVTQSAGSITVSQNFTVNTTDNSSFTQVNNVTSGKTLLNQGSGTTTIATLAANAGTISATAGGLKFTSPATNSATGLIYGNGGTLDFDSAVANSGTIQLASGGSATFGGNFTTVGTLTFPTSTFVTFDGATQNLPGVTYGTLRTSGSGTKTALAAVTVADAFDNGGTGNAAITTDFSTFSHSLPALANLDNTNGTVKFGGTNNGTLFNTGTVEYNAASGDQIIRGHATASYATLTLSGGGTKTVANSDNNVRTTGALSLPASINLIVESSRQLLVATGGTGDLTLAGLLTNNGVVTVGN